MLVEEIENPAKILRLSEQWITMVSIF